MYPNNPTKFYCNHPECSFKKGDIFDLIKAVKNPKFTDEDVASDLSHKYKITVKDDIDDIFKMYVKNSWCLFPTGAGSKRPVDGFMWEEKEHKDPKIWKEWIDRGYGVALRGGEVSNTIEIDIDSDTTYEKMKDKLGEDTLIQITKRGRHWIFKYDKAFDIITHKNFRHHKKTPYDMELRGNHAYVVIAPTSVEGEGRKWNNKPIKKMPKELKKFFLDLIGTDTKSVDDTIQEAIDKNEFVEGIKGLDNCCNDTFITYGGILRKKMTDENVAYALRHFNAMLENPMDKKSMGGILRQLQKYRTYDKQELADIVLKRLEIIKEGTAFQIAGTLKREQKDIEDVLKHLEDDNKVIALRGRKYQVLQRVEWVSEKPHLGVPIDFRMPFFHDYARFNQGGMLVIGSPTGRGKSHIAGNFIKQLWEQKCVTHLLNTEADSCIGKITDVLKIPDEAYLVPKKDVKHPMDIELVDKAITLIDWLRMKDGDFTQTENTFEHFAQQLRIHKGFLIILAQIRTSDNKFFAPDQIGNFAALMAKYLWGNNGADCENTYLLTNKIRDSKTGRQIITIPTFYHANTKIIEVRK
ncbi:hypothetical protein LCGC14_1462160, partial [marine sediment metagenome]